MNKYLLVLFVLLLQIACKKDESNLCTWGNSILDGKTFAPTSLILKSDNSNVTSYFFNSEPCLKNKITFSGTNFITIKDVNCTSSSSGTWLAKTIGDQKQLEVNSTTYIVTNNSCDFFTIESKGTTGTYANQTILITYTKQ